jgi:hypothetical protein
MFRKQHNERCQNCKESVRNLLASLLGAVEINWDLNIPCTLKAFENTGPYDSLRAIYEALQKIRGFDQFVRAKRLPRVDFFVPGRNLIIEFDESQHFTRARDIALSLYPGRQEFGFPVKKWRALCQTLDKRDNDPPYRDEQRAWYDTLRDFAPILLGEGHTTRLYSRDLVWCSLNPDSESDLRIFEQFLCNSECSQ